MGDRETRCPSHIPEDVTRWSSGWSVNGWIRMGRDRETRCPSHILGDIPDGVVDGLWMAGSGGMGIAAPGAPPTFWETSLLE